MLEEQDGAAIEQSGANRRISAIGLTTSVDTCIDITRDACTMVQRGIANLAQFWSGGMQ